MKIVHIAILLFLPLFSHAQSLVFMREVQEQKHIFIKSHVEVKQLTEGSHWHLYPSINSQASLVLWVEGESERSTYLQLFNLKQKSLTTYKHSNAGLVLHPRFSGNNQFVFYSAPNDAGFTKAFYLPLSELTLKKPNLVEIKLEGQHYFPRPSSDASFVVLQRNLHNKKEIVVYNLKDETFEVIAEGMSPTLSFDERYIAFTQKENGFWGIRLYDRFQKEIFVITKPESFDDMAPTFDPSGKLIFASNHTGHFQIYRLHQGERELIINSNEADDYAPQFSGEVKWSQDELPSLPSPARSSFASLSYSGKIYLSGGHKGSEHTYPEESFCDNFQSFDIASKTWTDLAPRPHKAHGYQMTAYGNYIYAFGGFAYSKDHNPKWKSLDFIDRYDIEKNEWQTIGNLPRARSSFVLAVVDEKAYLIGGWDSTPKFDRDLEGKFHSEVDVFNLKNENLEESPFSLPSPLRRAFTASVHDNKIYLIGGLGVGSSHFELLANITVIDPILGMSSELNPLPFATFAPAAEFLGNELIVFGGMFKLSEMNYEYVSHIYAFNLDLRNWRHTGRYIKETKGFSQVVQMNGNTLGILGGHNVSGEVDSPVATFETISLLSK